MSNITANVEDVAGQNHTVNFDIEDMNIDPGFMSNGNLHIFTNSHRVQDVWRYIINVYKNKIFVIPIVKEQSIKSNFADRFPTDVLISRVILLILESPHNSEYEPNPTSYQTLIPKAPAQGIQSKDAGGAIEEYTHLILEKIKLDDGMYCLLITNPIPYMCSLGTFHHSLTDANKKGSIRNSVWKEVWKIGSIKRDFINRCTQYRPEYILNSCTKDLQDLVTTELFSNGFIENLYTAYHPALNWSKGKFSIKKIISN